MDQVANAPSFKSAMEYATMTHLFVKNITSNVHEAYAGALKSIKDSMDSWIKAQKNEPNVDFGKGAAFGSTETRIYPYLFLLVRSQGYLAV